MGGAQAPLVKVRHPLAHLHPVFAPCFERCLSAQLGRAVDLGSHAGDELLGPHVPAGLGQSLARGLQSGGGRGPVTGPRCVAILRGGPRVGSALVLHRNQLGGDDVRNDCCQTPTGADEGKWETCGQPAPRTEGAFPGDCE